MRPLTSLEKKFSCSRKVVKDSDKKKIRRPPVYQSAVIAELEKRVMNGMKAISPERSMNVNFVVNDLQVPSLDEIQDIIPSNNIPKAETVPIWDLVANSQALEIPECSSGLAPSAPGTLSDLSHPDLFADYAIHPCTWNDHHCGTATQRATP